MSMVEDMDWEDDALWMNERHNLDTRIKGSEFQILFRHITVSVPFSKLGQYVSGMAFNEIEELTLKCLSCENWSDSLFEVDEEYTSYRLILCWKCKEGLQDEVWDFAKQNSITVVAESI